MKNRVTIQSILYAISIVACLSFTFESKAQQNVGIGTDNPHPSAKLDVVSVDQGVLVPRLKEAWRLGIVDPAKGLLVYDITHNAFFVYDFGGWKKILNEDQLPILDHISDGDNDTWIHTENNPDQDSIIIQVGGVDMGSISNKTFSFKSPGSSLFIGENSGADDDGSNNRNLFIGKNAGAHTTTGWENLMLGNDAGRDNVIGSKNIFIGNNAGYASNTAESNVVVGTYSGFGLTNGTHNVMAGYLAGEGIAEGNHNVLIGSRAGRFMVNGNNNIMIGREAGSQNDGGVGNVFIGDLAGLNCDGHNNVFMGNNAGQFELGSNKLYIDNSDTSEPLIYGEFDNDELTVNGSLKIKDEYTFPILDGANGQLLSTDGAGVLSWVENNANTTMLNDLDLDTKIQVEEMPDEDIIRFHLEGNEALILDRNIDGMARLTLNPLSSSILIGHGAGEFNEAFTNVLIGYNAGQNNTIGSSNTMMGNSAGSGNISGNLNTFLGSSSGAGNMEGSSNTFVGTLSGLFNNGGENVMVGTASGSAIFNGNRNVLLGVRAGQNGSNSSRNVKIGFEAGIADHTDDKLYIDNSSTNNPLIYGDFEDNHLRLNGGVGVNVTPNSQFHVNSTEDQPAMRIQVNNSTKLLVNENGGLTVGALQPDRTPGNGLYVHGSVNMGNTEAAAGYRLSVNGKVICEELRVEDSGDWPDYVFKTDYKLLSLSEVDAFIEKEGHLPNIPAAEIVEAEGFDTGDMVKRLLEKIEELTLHTIRQQEQIDELRKRIED